MSRRMARPILFTLMFLASMGVAACIVGPQELEVNEKHGFDVKVGAASLCAECLEISIEGPGQYKGKYFSHSIFTVFNGTQLISKTLQPVLHGSETASFYAVVSSAPNYGYTVSLEYGESRCMSYTFKYESK